MATKKARPAHSKGKAKSEPASKSIPEDRSGEPAPATSGPIIVGIAGSAGALSALQAFFDALPENPGMAFVVVTHLSPEHESHMAALLQAHTKMPVTQVSRKLLVQANQVYVIPPSKNISITDSHVEVSEFTEPHGKRTPIDFFFRTLAHSHRDAVAIILSGGGTDGSVGVKEVKEEGGLLLVQDPEEAEYSSMPNAAIGTGLVDLILPTRQIAKKLMELPGRVLVLPSDAEALGEHEWKVVEGILAQVQRRTKHDFSQYKRSTILRRVRRRMLLNNHPTLDSYFEYMRSHSEESFALLNDLLIGVTNFFRDPDAWEALKKQVIPQLFLHKDLGAPIRAWSVGCASGEEAYSLAMVIQEVASELDENRTIQIFASDIDEESLARAREGLYPAAIEADVSQERLDRFFIRQGNHYQVRRDLRGMIMFTSHSVLRDPPFSRQDLIVCRNLLIYLQRDVQQFVLDIFHYSLGSSGYLFLGNSETTAGKELFFQTTDKTHRIFQVLPWRPDQPHIPNVPPAMRVPGGARPPVPAQTYPTAAKEPPVLEEQHRRSLETFGPPSILISGDNIVLHVSETAGRYLYQGKGPLASDVLKLVRPELQMELRTAIHRAFEKNQVSMSPPAIVELDGVPRSVVMSVHPRGDTTESGQAAERRAVIVFLENEVQAPEPGMETTDASQAAARVPQLEGEIRRLRDELQTTQEEFESSTEEMRASNEELLSVNEEFHLTTEELETSKEELEAVNEELQTVNNELKTKFEEISRAHRDLENVLGMTEIATLFLSRELHIQRFTPSLDQFFSILKSDIGRPIGHLNHKLGTYDQLTNDAHRVLDDLAVVDREVEGNNGRWYLIRLRPYRTVEDKIEGVVVTFVDISYLKQTEDALKDLHATLEDRISARTQELEDINRRLDRTSNLFSKLFHLNPVPTSLTRLQDGMLMDLNDAYASFFGVRREDVLGKTTEKTGLPLQGPQRKELMARLQREGVIRDLQVEVQSRAGGRQILLALLQHVTIDHTECVLAAFPDITERVVSERQVRMLAANLTAAEQTERQRIAQILHDDLQQRLFAVKMQLSFLQQNYQQGHLDAAKEDSENLENWLSDAIETTRQLSVDMSPVVLKNGSVSDSLSWLAEEMRERYGLAVKLKTDERLPQLEDHLRILLFECVREVLFNVVKHGDILQAEVSLGQQDGHLQIEVLDHGKGFDAEKMLADAKAAHGLLDIRNRLNLLGCSMQIESRPGEGTRVRIEAPV